MSQKIVPTEHHLKNARFAIMQQVKQHNLNLDDQNVNSFVEHMIEVMAQNDANTSRLYTIIHEFPAKLENAKKGIDTTTKP